MVRDQVESPTDGGATTDATTSDRGVSIKDGEHLDVREARLGEDVVIECFGGAVGSPRAHGMFRNMCEIGTAQLDHRTERRKHAIGGSQSEPSEATHSRHGSPIITHWESTKFHWGIVVVAKVEM